MKPFRPFSLFEGLKLKLPIYKNRPHSSQAPKPLPPSIFKCLENSKHHHSHPQIQYTTMGLPNDGLPTYEEVISQENSGSNNPPLPARPQPQIHSHTQSYSHTTSSQSQSQYHGAPPQPPRPTNGLPFTYPPRYYCRKCRNTGYKIKNGHKCKNCWSKFYTPPPPAPRPPVSTVPVTASPITVTVNPSGIVYGPVNPVPGPPRPMGAPNATPMYVRPGDPRIGGYMCPACRGTGQVRFLLDKVPCVDCNGVGRVFNAYHRPY